MATEKKDTKKLTPQQSVDNSPLHPTDKDKKSQVDEVFNLYTEEEQEYLTFIQNRLEKSKRVRDQKYPEFNNKTYYQYFEENEKISNTFLEEVKNKGEVKVAAGTVEQKLDALLSHINNLNLEPEVTAYDTRKNKITATGNALTDVMHDTSIQDGGDGGGDEEKRAQRQRELLKQGTVFVQEEWLKKFEVKKRIQGTDFTGKFRDENGKPLKNWSEDLVKTFEGPSRTTLYGLNVYLGDITEFYIENQPFIAVVIQQDYEEARKRYRKFDNWVHVQKGKVPANTAHGNGNNLSRSTINDEKTIFHNKWRLTDVKSEQVEIILYQDQGRDEFQIIINGVMMLPLGFPLSAVSPMGRYNITKQIFRIFNNHFAYGGSFVSSGSIKEISRIIDESIRLMVLKFRKGITPAYVNTSGRVIDRKVLEPGRISMGIDPGALQPIASNEVQGVTAGEVGFMEKMQELIDKSTVSEQFTGQAAAGSQTATEIIEIQRQSRLTLGLTIAAVTFLEKKCAYLRLWNILTNWFEPSGNRVVEIEGARVMVNNYRTTSRETSIDGEGLGERMVILEDGELPDADTVRQLEIKEEKEKGFPVRKVFLNPEKTRNAIKIWHIMVVPKEKETSAFFKLIFRETLTDLITMTQLGSQPNLDGLEEEFSRIMGKPRSKLFKKGGLSPELSGVTSASGENINTPEQNAQASGRVSSGAPAGALGSGG